MYDSQVQESAWRCDVYDCVLSKAGYINHLKSNETHFLWIWEISFVPFAVMSVGICLIEEAHGCARKPSPRTESSKFYSHHSVYQSSQHQGIRDNSLFERSSKVIQSKKRRQSVWYERISSNNYLSIYLSIYLSWWRKIY